MRRSRDLRLSNAGPAALLAAVLAVPAALLVVFGARSLEDLYVTHMVAVGATMLIAGVAAVLLTRAGTRRGDVRAVTVGTAFAAMAALLLIHALATPEVFLDEEETGLLALAGGAALPVGAAILCLAAHPRLRGREGLGLLRRLQVVTVVWILFLGALGFADPSLVPSQPDAGGPAAIGTLVVTLGLFALIARRGWRTFSLTRRGADLWVCVGVGWLALALAAEMFCQPWSIGWWGGHALQTIGMLAIGIPVALDLRRDAPSHPLTGDLRGDELGRCEVAGEWVGGRIAAQIERDGDADREHADRLQRVTAPPAGGPDLAEHLGGHREGEPPNADADPEIGAAAGQRERAPAAARDQPEQAERHDQRGDRRAPTGVRLGRDKRRVGEPERAEEEDPGDHDDLQPPEQPEALAAAQARVRREAENGGADRQRGAAGERDEAGLVLVEEDLRSGERVDQQEGRDRGEGGAHRNGPHVVATGARARQEHGGDAGDEHRRADGDHVRHIEVLQAARAEREQQRSGRSNGGGKHGGWTGIGQPEVTRSAASTR